MILRVSAQGGAIMTVSGAVINSLLINPLLLSHQQFSLIWVFSPLLCLNSCSGSLAVNVSTSLGTSEFVNTGQLSVSNASSQLAFYYKMIPTNFIVFFVHIFVVFGFSWLQLIFAPVSLVQGENVLIFRFIYTEVL